MSNLIDEAEKELAVIPDVITHYIGRKLVDRLKAYEDALKHIAAQPEPATRQIAQNALDKHYE